MTSLGNQGDLRKNRAFYTTEDEALNLEMHLE